MEMNSTTTISPFLLAASFGLSALSAQAAESVSGEQASIAEHCFKVAGFEDAKAIKEMAREMSPDVILDKVFSAVAPDFQKAILSKPLEPGKPVKNSEAMREKKYFLPAIATMDMPFNWIRVRANGQVIEPSTGSTRPDPDWARLGKDLQKQALPEAQRY